MILRRLFSRFLRMTRRPAYAVAAFASTSLVALAIPLVLTIANPAPAAKDFFGVTTAWINNALLAVGSYSDDLGSTKDAGAVFILDGNPISGKFGRVLKVLASPDPSPDSKFGISMAVHGKLLVVGSDLARQGLNRPGAVYVFNADIASPNFGRLIATLANPRASNGDRYGFSVASVGSNILVGAFAEDSGANDAGAAYLFDGNTASPNFGKLIHTFENPSPGKDDYFGVSVAGVGGKRALIGAFRDDTNGIDSGSAYLFNADPSSPGFGTLLTTYLNPRPSATDGSGYNDEFGHWVTALGEDVVIAAFREDTGATDAGSVYLFDGNPASARFSQLLRVIDNPDPQSGDHFGSALSTLGKFLVAGAWRDQKFVTFGGSAYVYDADRSKPSFGQLRQALVSPAPTAYESFGTSVAAGPLGVAIGAIGTQGGAGAVYLVRIPPQ